MCKLCSFEEEEAKGKQPEEQEINLRTEKNVGVDRCKYMRFLEIIWPVILFICCYKCLIPFKMYSANWIQQPERKVWHPIVWQQPPPPIPPEDVGKVSH